MSEERLFAQLRHALRREAIAKTDLLKAQLEVARIKQAIKYRGEQAVKRIRYIKVCSKCNIDSTEDSSIKIRKYGMLCEPCFKLIDTEFNINKSLES